MKKPNKGLSKFEDILVWQKSRELTKVIYKITNTNRDWGFNDQIRRASVSIVNNIAEGFARKSNGDFKKFLTYSYASTAEVRSMLYLAKDLKYISENSRITLTNQTNEISKMIIGLSKALST